MHLLPWHGMHLSIQTWIGIFTFIADHSWVDQWLWVSIAVENTGVHRCWVGGWWLSMWWEAHVGLDWRVVRMHSECSNARLEQ